MTVQTEAVRAAQLRRADAEGSPFVPYASETPSLDEYGYVQEEWVATGDIDGEPYETVIIVRRPREVSAFSGTIIVETLHVHGIAPIWIYTAPYILRSGHAWVSVASQRTTLDMHVKPSNAERYGSLHIPGRDTSDFDPNPSFDDSQGAETFWSELEERNRAATPILAQVGAALLADCGPFDGWEVRSTILAGHSQTGSVATYYIRDAHDSLRLDDGTAVYDGYFPSGFPFTAFHDIDVPIVQVMSDGDVALPDFAFRPGYEGRQYRRDDSDEPGDRFRLYELAGVPHMGTRDAPFNDPALWQATHPTSPDVVIGPKMNSLPHGQLFSMGLDHLVRWVAEGIIPPHADRLELDDEGYVATDAHGNSVGGVRCVQLDVPHSTHLANPKNPDGRPNYLTIGNDLPFDGATLRRLYTDQADFVERFDARLDELVAAGWLLADDADEMRAEASQVSVSEGTW